VIIKGDHVLMIERGGEEGTGMIGLPGGFLERYERLLDGAVREGIEETGLFRRWAGSHDHEVRPDKTRRPSPRATTQELPARPGRTLR
jgi:ADP-ribose pyrophosphatase YjhB (NUDIX family)